MHSSVGNPIADAINLPIDPRVISPVAATVGAVAARTFQQRSETFGLDGADPWALDTLRLLFHVPRAYEPLVEAWDVRFPHSRRALDRLTELGFVAFQPAVILNTRTMELAERPDRPVLRFRTTHRGHQLRLAVERDPSVLAATFPQAEDYVLAGVTLLLDALDLDRSHARFGLSARHALELAGMPSRQGRWWIDHLIETGHVRRLDERLADTRAVVPAHWRVTRLLCRQLLEITDAFPETTPPGLAAEFRLQRNRFLGDVDPGRLGTSGATDFDHDIECQSLLALLLRSPRLDSQGIFAVEPRHVLDASLERHPSPLVVGAPGKVPYQPDAELRERDADGVVRAVVEYERYQSRRDAWSHIERFLGWLHQMALPNERAVLRFVVDTPGRERSYVELIEAFADYVLDHPERLPANPVTLAVTSMSRLRAVRDALDPGAWHRMALPHERDARPVPALHDPARSPYQEYFRRAIDEGEAE